MKKRSISVEQLDQMMRRIHWSRENLPTADVRIEAVMACIRSQPEILLWMEKWSFETLVWRLVPTTAALALALLGIWINVELIADADLFQLLYIRPQVLSLLNF